MSDEWTKDLIRAEAKRLKGLFLARGKEAREAGLTDEQEVFDWVVKRYPELEQDFIAFTGHMIARAESARIAERLAGLPPWRDDKPPA
jgi:hypothetical protein